MSSSLRPWRLIALALGAVVLVVGIVNAVARLLPGAGSPAGVAMQEAAFALTVAAMLAAVAIVGMRRSSLEAGSPPGGRAIGAGAAIGLACLFVALGDATLAGLVRPAGDAAPSWRLLPGLVSVASLAAAEELFFRGWLQPGLTRDWSEPVAIAVSALVFALLHLLGGARAPLSLLNLFLAGLLFGLLQMRSAGLAAPIAAHAAYNVGEQLLLGLDPNPGIGSFGAIWNLDLVGAGVWGGSGEGLNASLGLTVALLAAIAPLAVGALPLGRIPAPA